MIDVTHICICLDYPKLYTNMATGNDVTSHENDLYLNFNMVHYTVYSPWYLSFFNPKSRCHVSGCIINTS